MGRFLCWGATAICSNGNIVTVCGVGPTVDACAHLVERFFGTALAHRFLRHTSVERESWQMPAIDQLAAKVGLSARALTRRWLIATECGFSSSSALPRAFAQRFAKGPHRYRMDVRLEKTGTVAYRPITGAEIHEMVAP